MPIKILHILHDEKFIDGAIDIFNSTSAINTYVSIEDEKPFVWIKVHANDVQIVEKNKILSFILAGEYQLVAFHTLTRDKYEIVLQIPKQIKVLWLSWGYDIYSPNGIIPAVLSLPIYKSVTNRYVKSCKSEVAPLHTQIKRFIKKIILFKKYYKIQKEQKQCVQAEKKLQSKVLERIDFMSTVLPSEYVILSRRKEFNAEYFPFQYASKIAEPTWINCDADQILLGNSATETNNHLDVINILKKRGIKNKCILPCSYGDKKYYLPFLENLLKDDQQICILKDFIPRDRYAELLKSCRVGIFGHVRQQAVGNIIYCMLQGSKVFLYKDSMAYKYFKSNGYVIFSIEDDLSIKSISKLLTEEERMINVTKITELFFFDTVVSRLQKTIMRIEENIMMFE